GALGPSARARAQRLRTAGRAARRRSWRFRGSKLLPRRRRWRLPTPIGPTSTMAGPARRSRFTPMILAERSRGILLSGDVRPDAYLTDGFRLFRVVKGLPGSIEGLAVLEDCRTLEQSSYAAEEIWGMGLSVVRQAGPGS